MALLYLFFLLLTLFAVYCVRKHLQNEEFQRNMKPGDFCYYYEQEEREVCIIQKITGDLVIIYTQWDEVKEVKREELYV